MVVGVAEVLVVGVAVVVAVGVVEVDVEVVFFLR